MHSVWERTAGADTMSKNLFAFMVCFWTFVGIAASAVGANISQAWEVGWALILITLAVAVAGVFIAMLSSNPMISLLGYLMVAVPFGLLLGPVVATYTEASVVKALFLTTVLVAVLGFIGAAIPDSLESWGSWLFGSLILLLGGLFVVPLAGFFGLPVEGAMTWLDWVGVLIFSAYVVYDFNRAMRLPRTMDNAIDIAVAIYLDFANLFIRLLALLGKKKD